MSLRRIRISIQPCWFRLHGASQSRVNILWDIYRAYIRIYISPTAILRTPTLLCSFAYNFNQATYIFQFFKSHRRQNALQSNPLRHAGLCHCCTCRRSDSRWAHCEFFSLFNNVVDLLMDACWQDATQKRQRSMIRQTSREPPSTWAKSPSVFSFLPACTYLPCPTLSQKVEHIVTTIEC